ncbi:16S rRNA (guanine(966)-N(2))-methyltransferase RsmD [bacterium CG_4_9_14_3_um_filter_65_15]|nr:MAG: 16S rRNA (guanine(966)-N(2))-methyltransferase RsmD [bacterium CG_4_9_14_3_um_filter_65_15]
MRVIAGQWKGRRLLGPSGKDVRPTTDRVKEAMFNLLARTVSGSMVLDVCCGSGGLGIEALSRGAEHAVFIDVSRASLGLTRRNLENCGADRSRWTLVSRDALTYLQSGVILGEQGPLLLLCDPPYGSPVADACLGLGAELLRRTGFRGAVVEMGARAGAVAAGNAPWEFRRYGRTRLAILRPKGQGVTHD